ncbi:hypothetical protein TNIN_455211 [Trichonephila inaurata madagascariensis]|uniref:Uncharacterized protein n=1 Tax=Trichonephila inaurata madagascariensis TaxID=2747483 RepID=A0A8X7CCQ3_9ARAC|nr:hypothetical protein TNIN_455211 [Trichonephila inaurata madagascariensis]
MDALKLKRMPLRTAFTKAVNHLQESSENDPVDMNSVETAFKQLKIKNVKLKEQEDAVLELMIESNCTQEAYNIEFETIEDYAEKMIAWQVRLKNIMKTDALGQKDNHSLITSSASSLRLPKIQFQQFSGELTDWLRFHNHFKRIHEDESIDEDFSGRYEVALPWILDNKLLSSNKKLAENRLESTKRKLNATGKFEEYQVVLDLWLSEK